VRAGISQIILPIENEADLEDIPEDLRTSLTFHLASTLDDVVKIALADRKKPKKRRASAKRHRSVKNAAATA
jgi:ATP-dependent Lon protease